MHKSFRVGHFKPKTMINLFFITFSVYLPVPDKKTLVETNINDLKTLFLGDGRNIKTIILGVELSPTRKLGQKIIPKHHFWATVEVPKL